MRRYVVGLTTLIVLVVLTVAPATAQTFDNSGGSGWQEYMSFPITTTPTEDAQYKIVISGTAWEIYNSSGGLKTSGSNSNFWSLVQSGGDDIRVFDQNSNQLYFWTEYWNYTNQLAVIWVKVPANTQELNIAYGNPSATKSNYNNGSYVFELYDDFNTLNLTKWQRLSDSNNQITVQNGELVIPAVEYVGLVSAQTFDRNIVIIFRGKTDNAGQDSALATGWSRHDGSWFTAGYYTQWRGSDGYIAIRAYGDGGNPLATYTTSFSANTYYRVAFIVSSSELRAIWYDDQFNTICDISGTNTSVTGTAPIHLDCYDGSGTGNSYWDYIAVAKLADPASFGTPVIKSFQERFGTKTVYVNVTYLDTGTTERYNPPAYYTLEDKPQINVTSTLSISGVNATYGANVTIELIEFVTLDKAVYNGTDITANLTYQGTVTNATTGYTYNVYNFTTYENGVLEIYGHIANKAYEATYKLDGEPVDIFNVTAVIGEVFEITLPHIGNVSIEALNYIGVSSVQINTKDVGVGAKTLSIVIKDPENFTVGYKARQINIDWGKINFNITDLQNKPFTKASYGILNENYGIVSSDPAKLYAGNNTIDIYFHGVKLKSVRVYLNHTNNGLTLNVSVNATQPTDYRGLTRIIASPNYFEVVNLSANYPFSVMKLVNASGTVVVDYVSNAPTSVEVVGATSYEYEKPLLRIVVGSNVTVTDLYKLSVPLKDRLGNPVNFYALINGSRADASNGVASKLLKPSWYEVEVPVSVSGFELWSFYDTSNVALVEVNASDVTLPTAEYRVPSKFETKEVRIQKLEFWTPFPFLSENKPAQDDEIPIVRLQGTLRDFYNAPIPNRNVTIEVASPNFTRIYNVTTDNSGNFKVDLDMARGVEYTITYRFEGDDTYVGTSTSKTFYVEELPEEEIIEEIISSELLIAVVIVIATVGAIVAIIYISKKQRAVTRAKMESEFKFFRRLK